MQHLFGAAQAAYAGARKLFVGQQEAHYPGAIHALARLQAVHLIGRQRAQHAHPQHGLERAQLRRTRPGHHCRGAHVHDAAGHVGTFDVATQGQERQRIAFVEDDLEHAGQCMSGVGDSIQKAVARAPGRGFGGMLAHIQVEFVDLLPHLARQDVAHGAGDLAGAGDGSQHRSGILGIGDDELDHRFLAVVTLLIGVQALVAGDFDQRPPARTQALRQVEHQAGADVHQPGQILGALQVARHPVEIVSYARKHGRPRCRLSRCLCCRRPARNSPLAIPCA